MKLLDRFSVKKINATELEEEVNASDSFAGPKGYDYQNNIKILLIKGLWDKEIAQFMVKKKFDGLSLNYSKGWKGNDYHFISRLPFLKLLRLLVPPVDDLRVIESLGGLLSLSLSCHWCKEIDFSGLDNLEHCYISWDKGADSVFQCRNMKYLSIDGFKVKDYSNLRNLEKLQKLTISNSDFSELDALSSMKKIKKLELINCRNIESLKGLEHLRSLEWLSIDGCRKIASINETSQLTQLKIFQLRDNKELESLEPLRNLKNLEALSFFGDTKFIDGNLDAIESLKKLSLAGFTNRRHYSHQPIMKNWNWENYGEPKAVIERKH